MTSRNIGKAATVQRAPQCPGCGGNYLKDHPNGVLYWDHDSRCTARDELDGRMVGDRELIQAGFTGRYASAIERELLNIVGYPASDNTVALFTGPGSYRYQQNTGEELYQGNYGLYYDPRYNRGRR